MVIQVKVNRLGHFSCSTSWFDCIVPMRISKPYQNFPKKSDKFLTWQVSDARSFLMV